MHRNARLTPAGRLLLCQRIEGGWPVAHAAESMGISRDRAYVWWRRYQSEGLAGLEDRSSRPHRTPSRTKASKERRIVHLRRKRGLGPARIAGIVKCLPRRSMRCWCATASTASTAWIELHEPLSGAWR
jgi:transposase-like protein